MFEALEKLPHLLNLTEDNVRDCPLGTRMRCWFQDAEISTADLGQRVLLPFLYSTVLIL